MIPVFRKENVALWSLSVLSVFINHALVERHKVIAFQNWANKGVRRVCSSRGVTDFGKRGGQGICKQKWNMKT